MPPFHKRTLADLLGCEPDALPEPDRYEVLEKLGDGGMGSVFLARDTRLAREVAIKVVGVEGNAVGQNALMRFHREARAVAALNHSSIIRVFDYSGPTAPTPYIVMERLSGRSFQSLVDAGPVPEPVCVAIAYELCAALVHAHRVGVLHRDIKPENVFLEPDGRVVLMDFGLAKGLLAESDRETFVASKTQIVGTPAFCSPEQLSQKHALSPASDLFSLGSVLYYALTQVFPFRGETVFEIIRSVVVEPHAPLRDLVEVTPAFEALIDALLSKDPSQRPANAESLQRRLRELVAMHDIRVPSEVVAAMLRGQVRPIAQVARPAAPTTASLPASRGKARIVALVGAIAATVSAVVLAIGFVLRPAAPAVSSAEIPSPAAREPSTAPARVLVNLHVVVTPWGKVSIDGKLRGTTPSFSEVALDAGEHEIEITHPTLGRRVEHVVLSSDRLAVELEVNLSTGK